MTSVDYTSMFKTPSYTAAEKAALTGSTAEGTNASSGSKSMADYQTFLKLLVTQMKTQDPTNPMDATQQVAQLATFSQVEQSIQMNAKLDQMMQASSLGQANDIIGRTVTSADGKVSGVVSSVQLGTSGITAILADGTKLAMTAGVTIK